jgi:hypothetical protein
LRPATRAEADSLAWPARHRRRFERSAHVRQNLPDRLRFRDEGDETDVAATSARPKPVE